MKNHKNYTRKKAKDLGFINHDWFSEREVLVASKQLPAAVYSFTFSRKRPTKKDFPCDFEETIYVGQSAGKIYFDRKNPNGTGQIKSTFTTRWHQHHSAINAARRGESTDPKYISFAEYETAHPELTWWINLLSPNVNGTKESLSILPSKCISLEGDSILDYALRWGDAPLMNRAQNGKNDKRKKNSISSNYINNMTPELPLSDE